MRQNNLEKLKKQLDEFEFNYIKDILSIPKLSNEETLELVLKVKNGDLEASKKLIYHNLSLVLSTAYSYSNESLDIFDLLHDGSFAIVDAAIKYNINSNTKLSTWFNLYIQKYTMKNQVKYTQYVPCNIYYAYLKYKKIENILELKFQTNPTENEIIKNCNMPKLSYYKKYFNRIDNLLPLFECVNIENLNSDPINNILELLITTSIKNDFDKIYKEANLNDNEIKIMKLYYGLDGNDNLMLKDIAKILNLSPTRIGQIRTNAYNKIIKCDYLKHMAKYTDNPDKSLKMLSKKRKCIK